MSMILTDAEAHVVALLVYKLSREEREDVIGGILKNTGHQILRDGEVAALATKLEAVLHGKPCLACDGEGVLCPGKGYEHTCYECNGEGKFNFRVHDTDDE